MRYIAEQIDAILNRSNHDFELIICNDCFTDSTLTILRKFEQKVGFSLKIDDLPECYIKKYKVIDWESQFWKKEIITGIYSAAIDTTFALHRPWVKTSFLSGHIRHYRTGYPYQARHLPWYEDSDNISEEILYYYEHTNSSNTW